MADVAVIFHWPPS
ncbi:GpE family phage tail protein, partial [Escherichia coli]